MAFLDQLSTNPDQLDAAGGQPVSQRIITGNYLQFRDNLPLLFDRVGTGTQSYANGEVQLSVAANQYVLCQSKAFSPYLAGKPTGIKLTFRGMSHVVDLTQRVGFGSRTTSAPYVADFDGFYFESNGTDYQIVTANKAFGAEAPITQANWDDPLDGSGPSKLTVDFTKFTVLEFDFLYLGGTALRCFVNIGGQKVLFHTIKWSNDKDNTIFLSPNQPVFYEVRSSGGVGGFTQICAGTEVQGTLELVGVDRGFDNETAFINASTIGTNYLLKAIRLQSAKRDAFVKINSISTMALTNDYFKYFLVLNPTIAGTVTWNTVANSVLEEADGATNGTNTVTGGTRLLTGYVERRTAVQKSVNGLLRLGTTIAGVSDIIAVCAQPLQAGLDALAGINTTEI